MILGFAPDNLPNLTQTTTRLKVSITSLQYEVVQKKNYVMQCFMWRMFYEKCYDEMFIWRSFKAYDIMFSQFINMIMMFLKLNVFIFMMHVT